MLADRFRKVVLSGFSVEAHDGKLNLSAHIEHVFGGGATSLIRENYECWGEMPDAARLERICAMALDDLQDVVGETTVTPWPGEARPPKARAEIRNGAVYLFFSDEDRVVLDCGSIELDQL
jgi:hypothetical protein